MPQTENIPRTHVTIWGAPNTSTIPATPPTAQPQLMRPKSAATPRPMTAITATGVRIERKFVWNDEAPVENGLVCANDSSGIRQVTPMSSSVSDTVDARRPFLEIRIAIPLEGSQVRCSVTSGALVVCYYAHDVYE